MCGPFRSRGLQVESQDHQGWKKTRRLSSPTIAQYYHCNPWTTSPRTRSRYPLNTSRAGESATSLGNLFQCLTTPTLEKEIPSASSLSQFKAISSGPHCRHSRIDWPAPHYTLLSDACREKWGPSWASSTQDWADIAPSAVPLRHVF